MLVVHPGRPEHSDGPEGYAFGLIWGDDERALGQGLDGGVLRADRDRLSLGENVAQERDHDVGLLEYPEYCSHLFDSVETLRHEGGAADEDLIGGAGCLAVF